MMKKYKEIDDAAVIDLLENTLIPIDQIARKFGVRTSRIMEIQQNEFHPHFIAERKRQCYSASKSGNKNPMWGIEPEQHPRFIGEVADGNGYIMVLKPDWFTGRPGSKHVFKHTVVMCENLGITELPRGFVVHHINHDRTDNTIDNLALMSVNAHSRIHSLEAQRLAEMRRELATSEVRNIYRNRRRSVRVDGDIVHSSE
jgi:hypothetical protein